MEISNVVGIKGVRANLSEKYMIYHGINAMNDTGMVPLNDSDGGLLGKLCHRLEYNETINQIGSIDTVWHKEEGWRLRDLFAHLWLYRWAECAFPTVVINQEQIGAYGLADINVKDTENIKYPWPAFIIRIPPGTLLYRGDVAIRIAGLMAKGVDVLGKPVKNPKTNDDETAFLGAHFNYELGLGYHFVRVDFQSGISVHLANNNLHSILFINLEDELGRLMAVAARVYMCVLCELQTTNDVRRRDVIRKLRVSGVKEKIGVQTEEYTISRPITINMIQAAKNYISKGARFSCKSRWMVRGHWRRQAHGPGRKKRKLVFVEPHWKGPECGSILVRPHVIGKR